MLMKGMFEFVFAILFLYFALADLIFPLIRGTGLFLMSRKKAHLEDQLREAKQHRHEEDLRTQIKNEEKKEHPH